MTAAEIRNILQGFGWTIEDAIKYGPGWSENKPLYTTEAKPGFLQMAADTVRNDYQRAEKFQNWTRSGFDWLTQPRTKTEFLGAVAYTGLAITTIPLMAIIMKKGSDALIDIIKYKMTTPKLEIIDQEAHPKYGRMDRLRRWWAGYATPPVIFDQSVKDRLEKIKEKTKNIRNHIYAGDKSATYTNLLLYGAPGTGKTLFARVLADYADMNFLPTTAAGLLQSTVAFNDLLEMANRSKYGTIIFIDEADALFIDRNKLLESTAPDALAQYKALNHILAKIGQRNNKYMIVAATNFAHVMDEAMDRRFPESVEMPLPDALTRLELLTLYIGNQLFNEKNNSKEFVKVARSLLTPQFIESLVPVLEGFSHAKIQSFVQAMKDATRATKDGMLTMADIQESLDQAIKKHRVSEENKLKRAKMFGSSVQQEVQEIGGPA